MPSEHFQARLRLRQGDHSVVGGQPAKHSNTLSQPLSLHLWLLTHQAAVLLGTEVKVHLEFGRPGFDPSGKGWTEHERVSLDRETFLP